MKQFVQSSASHRFAFLIAVAMALGITVHELFLLVAQIMALTACVYLMIGAFHHGTWNAKHAHRNL